MQFTKLFSVFFMLIFLANALFAEVRTVQKQLNVMGYQAGPEDGLWGNKTENAIKLFLSDNSLKWDGIFDQNEIKLIEKIFLSKGFKITPKLGVKAFSIKDTVIDEIDISGTGYYGRLLVSEDFNNDGNKEFVYIKLSPSYMNYVWSSEGMKKRNDKNYNQKGIELSKSPEWFASFLWSKINGNKPVLASREANFNGNLGCVHPSQIIPDYLNEDAFLDFVIPCHGYDAPPFPGEHSIVLLSDGPNNYNLTQLTDQPGFYHDGATSDFNGDGKIDILLVDAKADKLRVLINKGYGKFQLSNKYFPKSSSWQGAYTTEILDVNDDGFFDIFVA